MADGQENNHSSRMAALVTAAVVGLPLIYILSVGPAVEIDRKVPLLRGAIETFYSPVVWLDTHTFMRKPLDSYAGFWRHIAGYP